MKIGFFLLIIISLFTFSNANCIAFEDYNYSYEELINGVYLNEEMFFVNDGFEYQLNNIIIGNDCYLVLGEYIDINEDYRFIDSLPYLAFYQGNSLKWIIKTDTFGHGRFVSGIISDDSVVVAGTFETTEQITQIGIFEINFNGDILNYFITTGNENSKCVNLHYYANTYYVTGETKASNLGYGDVSDNNHILVMAFTEKLFNFNNLYLSNDGNSNLYKSFFSGETIFLFGEICGKGYFNFEGDRKNLIFSVSERLDLDMYKEVNQEKNDEIIAINDQILFIEYGLDPSKVKVTKYGYGLDEVKEMYLNLGLNVYDIQSYNGYYALSDELILLGFTFLNNATYYDSLTLLDINLNKIYNVEVKKNNTSRLEYVAYIDGALYSFGLNENAIYGNKIIEVQALEEECYYNGIKGEKIIEQTNEDTFGLYKRNIKYKYNDIIINTYVDYYVEPKCSIVDKKEYDLGVKLEFNGVGYLNGEKIENGFIVNEYGSYLLEVVGKEESKYYTFIVKDLTIKDKYLNNQEIKINEIILKENSNLENLEYHLNLDMYEESQYPIFYLVIFIVLGLIIGIFIPYERIGKKRG